MPFLADYIEDAALVNNGDDTPFNSAIAEMPPGRLDAAARVLMNI